MTLQVIKLSPPSQSAADSLAKTTIYEENEVLTSIHGHYQPVSTQAAQEQDHQEWCTCPTGFTAEAWCLHQGVYNHTQEAKFSTEKGLSGASGKWL